MSIVLQASMNIVLQAPRDIVSPRKGKQRGTPAPTVPGDPGFASGLEEVQDCVQMAELGGWPSEALAKGNPTQLEGQMPSLIRNELKIYGRHACRNLAMSVSMDHYWDLGVLLFNELSKGGVKFANDDGTGHVHFCDYEVSHMAFMIDLLTEIQRSMNNIFDVKYFWKAPRPEDYLGVKGCIFTLDGEGAPGHYGYGAGHAAAARATDRVLRRRLFLSPDLAQQVTHECFTFAFGRTPLGVHFIEDNLLGWRVGGIEKGSDSV